MPESPTPSRHRGDASRDRSGGLVLAGTSVTGVGCVGLALVGLMWFVSRSQLVAPDSAMELRVTLPVAVFYVLLSLVMVLLGIASMGARRWACDLLLALSRIWLITGVCTVLVVGWMVPAVMRQTVATMGAPAQVAAVASGIVLVLLLLVQVAIPAALVLFYRSPEVAATCDARHGRERPTVEIPQPILMLAVLWALVGASVLVMPAYNMAFPWFGRLLAGTSGIAPWVAVMVACLILAWGTLRRARWAWWGAMAAVAVAAADTMITSSMVDADELLAALALPPSQMRLWASLPAPGTVVAVLFWFVVWGSFAAWIARLRPHFDSSGRSPDD